jgi:hypothetical protein
MSAVGLKIAAEIATHVAARISEAAVCGTRITMRVNRIAGIAIRIGITVCIYIAGQGLVRYSCIAGLLSISRLCVILRYSGVIEKRMAIAVR